MEFLGLILSVVIAIYLALDSPKYGKNPWLWGVLGFIFSLLTLGIYLIQTNRKVAGWILLVIAILYWLFILFVVIGIAAFYSLYS
jgi:hypothetical protein